MTAMPKPRRLTVAEYFALEEKAERRSEFHDGQMFLMAGASREHNIINRNLSFELQLRLRGGSCQVFYTDQRVKADQTGRYLYPDLLIVCGQVEYAPENRDTILNPRVVIEVLSESTEKYDRTIKFRYYKNMPSVVEYVLVAQDSPLVERFCRLPDNVWTHADFVGLDSALSLVAAPITLPLADIYRGVEFPPPLQPLV